MTRTTGRLFALAVAGAVVLTGLTLPGAPPAAAAEGRTISGVVSLPSTAPAEWRGAVSVMASPIAMGMSKSAMIDPATGAYSITDLPPGQYRLQFSPTGYWDGTDSVRPNLVAEYYDDTTDYMAAEPVDVTTGDASGIDADLALGRTISGTVTLPDGVDPSWIESVSVSAMGGSGFFGSSTSPVDPATGDYTITGLTPGAYTVKFDTTAALGDPQPDLVPEYWDDSPTLAGATPVDVTAGDRDGIDAGLAQGTSISGTVTIPDDAPSDWLRAVRVSAIAPDGTYTDFAASVDPATGEYTIDRLAASEYRVAFNAWGYFDGMTYVETNLATEYYDDALRLASASIVSTAAGDAHDVDAELGYGASLEGTVDLSALRAAPGGAEGFGIHILDADGEMVSGWGDPFYDDVVPLNVRPLPPGTYRIAVETSRWDAATNRSVPVSVQFLRFGGGTTITLEAGEQLTGLRLTARATDATVTGSIRAQGFAAQHDNGTLGSALFYERDGQEWARLPARFDATENGTRAFSLRVPAATYTVGYEDAYSTAGVTVQEQWWNAKTDLANADPIEAVAGQTRSGIDGVIRSTGPGSDVRSITGVVSIPDDAPSAWLGSIRVSALSTTGMGASASVDPVTGAYALANLQPDQYRLQFSVNPYYEDGALVWPNLAPEYYDDATAYDSADLVDVTDGSVGGVDAALAEGRTISGTVALPEGAEPEWMRNVTVTATAANGLTAAATKPDPSTGEYEIVGLPVGAYTVHFSVGLTFGMGEEFTPNLVSEFWNDAISAATATPVDVTTANRSGIDAQLALGRTISGRVSVPDDVPSDWLRAVHVAALTPDGSSFGRGANVDPETGDYSLTGLPAADLRVAFTAGAYFDGVSFVSTELVQEYYDDARYLTDATVVSTAQGDRSGIDADLDRGGRITGTFDITALRGSAEGFGITLTDASGTKTQQIWGDALEYYEDADDVGLNIGTVAPGTYRIAVTTQDFNDETHSSVPRSVQFLTQGGTSLFTVIAGEDTDLDLTARAPGATVSGSIKAEGFPAGTAGSVLGSALMYTRLDDGWVRLPDTRFDVRGPDSTAFSMKVPAGSYTVGFEADFSTSGVATTEQWWKSQPSLASATSIDLTASSTSGVIKGLVHPVGWAPGTDPGTPSTPFTDVPADHPFSREIGWLSSEGISLGWNTPTGTREYRPGAPINRDQMAAFLYRFAGSPTYTPPVTSPFVDVPTIHPFYREISWLASEGISLGWNTPSGAREYRPGAPINRDQMAAFLYRFAAPQGADPVTATGFIDVPASHDFLREITWLASNGISLGWSTPAGREYRPGAPINRDQMAAFLYRLEAIL